MHSGLRRVVRREVHETHVRDARVRSATLDVEDIEAPRVLFEPPVDLRAGPEGLSFAMLMIMMFMCFAFIICYRSLLYVYYE